MEILIFFYYTWQDHGRSQRSSKSSSPDTKRQKLDEGKESISNSEETTENNLRTTAEVQKIINTEVIVINAEESCHEQAASEMQPMTVDEDMLEKQTQQQQADSDVGKWSTICGLQCSFSSEDVCRKKPLMACAKLLISPSELSHIFLLNLRRIFPISIYKFSRLI